MFEQVSKKQYTLYGIIYMLSGLALIGLSVNMFMEPEKKLDIAKIESKIGVTCKKKLNDMYALRRTVTLPSGLKTPIMYNISYENKEVKIKSNSMLGGLEMIRNADAMIGLCQGMKMQSFCMGSECKPSSGFNMTLIFNGIVK